MGCDLLRRLVGYGLLRFEFGGGVWGIVTARMVGDVACFVVCGQCPPYISPIWVDFLWAVPTLRLHLMNLNERWESVLLSEVTVKVGSGSTPRGGSKSYKSEGIPLIRSMNIHFDGFYDDGLVFLDDQQAKKLDNVTVQSKDVLLNITGASIGRVTQATSKLKGARVNQHVCIIRTNDHLNGSFLSKYLSSPLIQDKILFQEYGVTRQALTKQAILDFTIPLPPLNEQRRIVAKIEELNDRISQARMELEAAREAVGQFRQSVLAAAFRGDLTADWRAAHPDVEPAAILLERIRAERRRKWEEVELAKMIAKGKPPQNDKWKARYKEPQLVNTTPLEEIPHNWLWVQTDVIADIDLGKMLDKGKKKKGQMLPYLRNQNVRWFDFDLDEVFSMDFSDHELERFSVHYGDVLVCEGGEPGRAAVWRSKNVDIKYQKTLHRVRFFIPLPQSWLIFKLKIDAELGILDKYCGGSTIKHLTKISFQQYPIPLPPLEEQKEIVKGIEAAFDRADKIETEINASLADLKTLDQAILAKAFRGELVPQDPNDEPASELLKRIEAAKAAAQPQKQKKTTRRKRNKL